MKIRIATTCTALLAALLSLAQPTARLIAEGDSLLNADRPQKAIDRFTQAVETEPTAAHYAARARGWYYMERMDRFVLDVEQALQLDSLLPEANYQRALYAARSEDHRGAERFTTRALDHGAVDPVRRQALILRGEARVELKRYREAVADLSEGLGERTDDLPAMKALARAHDALGDHAASLVVLEKLCTVEPFDIGNWTNRGFELAALGRHEEALSMFDEALALDKDEPTALSDRAHTLLQLGRVDEALDDVERSLKSYPANAFALRTRALLYLSKNNKEKACEDLQLARIIGGVPEVDALIEQHCAGVAPKR